MAKYGPKAQEKVEKSMHDYKKGELRSGKSGKPVSNPKQAVASGVSKARTSGAKVPRQKQSQFYCFRVATRRKTSAPTKAVVAPSVLALRSHQVSFGCM